MARNAKLYAEHVISAKDRDDARAALDSSRGAVTAAQANVQFYTDQLNDTVIRAPIAGIVVSKTLEVGEWVDARHADSDRRRPLDYLGARRRGGDRPRRDPRRRVRRR